jgi:thioredoxin-dependent peroxiredoxin
MAVKKAVKKALKKAAKKVVAKKVVKKAVSKVANKLPAKKAVARKAVPKKVAATKKAVGKKTTVKKTAPAKKVAPAVPVASTTTVATLNTGDSAPPINLLTDAGIEFKLSDQAGKFVVVYFYPKADTPGCTVEACSFRDANSDLQANGVVVVGISPDQVKALAKFRDKFHLNFPLLSDPDHAAADAYGTWVEKSMYGRSYMGMARSTFVIGKDGKIAKIYPKVTPKGHAEEVLANIAAL